MTGRLQDRIALICSAQHRCEHRRVFSRRAHGSSSSIAIRSAGRPAGRPDHGGTAERQGRGHLRPMQCQPGGPGHGSGDQSSRARRARRHLALERRHLSADRPQGHSGSGVRRRCWVLTCAAASSRRRPVSNRCKERAIAASSSPPRSPGPGDRRRTTPATRRARAASTDSSVRRRSSWRRSASPSTK